MQMKHALLPGLALLACSAAPAQTLELDFDTSRSGYGIRETSGTDVQLSLAINGSPTAADNFDELDNLASATVAASGSALGGFSPFTFSMSASAGDDMDVQGDGIDVSGGGFDAGETLTFVFDTSVLLTGLDFEGIGPGETARVTIAGTVFDFGDNTGDSHLLSENLAAGNPLVFEYGGATPASYNLQGMTLSIVPEPSTYALATGLAALALLAVGKRKR
jgi:hypothetical protein